MLFARWLKRVPPLSSRGQGPRSRRGRPQVKPLVEALEVRWTPTAFTVNSTADTTAANLFTGTDATGHVTLRSALQAANAAQNGGNTITLPAGTYNLTRAGANEDAAATGDLDVFNNVT